MGEDAKRGGRFGGLLKAALGAGVGLFSGAAAMYGTAFVDRVVKPPKPVASFAVAKDGLAVTCQNHATGESGWWDFGDGTPLEPFDPGTQTFTHTYAQPGSYSVKLVVRNYLMDESERTVPVDLSGAAPAAAPPQVAGLKVEPIGPRAVAPATFRVRGEVKNAERALLDLGDRIEVSTEAGPVDRLVVFEKPGNYPIQLIGQSGKQAVKQAAYVQVAPPAAGTLSVVVTATDVGTRTDRHTVPTTVPLPAVPQKGVKGPEKVIAARPGFAVVEAKVGAVHGPALKNLKAEVAADRRSVRVSGEWASANPKAAGGADVMVPVMVVEERAVPVSAPPQHLGAVFPTAGAQQAVALPLPPQPLGVAGAQRRYKIELRLAGADGQTRTLLTDETAKLPWTGTVPAAGRGMGPKTVTATQIGNALQVACGY